MGSFLEDLTLLEPDPDYSKKYPDAVYVIEEFLSNLIMLYGAILDRGHVFDHGLERMEVVHRYLEVAETDRAHPYNRCNGIQIDRGRLELWETDHPVLFLRYCNTRDYPLAVRTSEHRVVVNVDMVKLIMEPERDETVAC